MSEGRAADVSVVIATRDRPETLARALDAVRSNHVQPREVVVTDQSVGGRSAEAVRARTDALNVRYIRHDGAGLAGAQNLAFKHVRSSIVAVTDDDCVPAEGWIGTIADRFRTDPQLAALTGRVVELPDEDTRLVPVSLRTDPRVRTFTRKHVPWEVGSGNNFAVRRDWLEIVGGNDERLGPGSPGQGGVDMDLFYRLLRAGGRIRYDPDCLVFHGQVTAGARLARRIPYGHGIGAGVAIWLREGDLFAPWVLMRWLAQRLRRCLIGASRGDWTRAREEVLVLRGTAAGLVFGFRAAPGRAMPAEPGLPRST